jgi:hypothetical protein
MGQLVMIDDSALIDDDLESELFGQGPHCPPNGCGPFDVALHGGAGIDDQLTLALFKPGIKIVSHGFELPFNMPLTESLCFF